MKTVWVSLRALKKHEFLQTLRHIRAAGDNWHDIYTRLGVLQEEAVAKFLKTYAIILPIYLTLSAFGSREEVSVTISGITAAIPTSYVTIVASVIAFVCFQHLQSVVMLISIRSDESVKHKIPRFSANSYGLYHGQDESALTVPVVLNWFLKSKSPIPPLVQTLMLLVYSALLIPLVAFFVYILFLQASIAGDATLDLISRATAAVGVLIQASTIAVWTLFNIPAPFQKDVALIRWLFLSKLYPIGQHPRIAHWLGDSDEEA